MYSNMQPSIALNFIIALRGIFPSAHFKLNYKSMNNEEQFIGEIRMFTGNFNRLKVGPFATGQCLIIDKHHALIFVVGSICSGNTLVGASPRLPDLRSRVPVNHDRGSKGSGYSVVGTSVGSETASVR
jgi:microcystin-dependent protein